MPLQGLEELVDMAGLSCWEVRLHDFQTRPSCFTKQARKKMGHGRRLPGVGHIIAKQAA